MNNEVNIQEMVDLARCKVSADEQPVVLTQKEVEASNERKAKKQRTIRQLPVFRAASNVAFCVAQIETRCPKKMRCFVDELERLTSELMRVIVLANEYRTQRRELCSDAYSLVITTVVKLEILEKLHVIGKDEYKKIKKLLDSLTAQLRGWQNSIINEGIQNE